MELEQVFTGTVKWFNAVKGYGFVIGEDGKDVFVHHSGVSGEHRKGFQNLQEGQRVTYEIGQHEKGPMCVNVRVIQPSPSE